MKKIVIFYMLLISSAFAATEIDKAFILRGNNSSAKFVLYSPDIIADKQISEAQVYDGFGCKGKNIPPRLTWKNAPSGTKSFAITIFDENAITGNGWWNWIVYNIPVNFNGLDMSTREDKIFSNEIVQATNDYGLKKYGGMCPPPNSKNNYVVSVYALNTDEIDLPKNATPAMAILYIKLHTIDTAKINAFYGRNIGVVYKKNNDLVKLNNGDNINSSLDVNNATIGTVKTDGAVMYKLNSSAVGVKYSDNNRKYNLNKDITSPKNKINIRKTNNTVDSSKSSNLGSVDKLPKGNNSSDKSIANLPAVQPVKKTEQLSSNGDMQKNNNQDSSMQKEQQGSTSNPDLNNQSLNKVAPDVSDIIPTNNENSSVLPEINNQNIGIQQ